VSVQVTDTVTGCISEDQQIIEVIETPKPEPYLGQDTTLIFGQTITLDAGPGSEYEWLSDDPLVTIPNPDHQLIQAIGTQEGVTYFVDVWENGCKGSGSIFVGEYPRCAADVPTAFTPNGDGRNDVLYVRGNGLALLEFKIFNRYGKLVYETGDYILEEGWDGTINGEKSEMEVYTYYLKAICEDAGLIEQKGNITLIR